MRVEEIIQVFHLDKLPEHMQHGVVDWIKYGAMPGGFLSAVLRNDLADAFARADLVNMACMRSWAHWLYHDAPAGCWGSDVKMKQWREHGGLSGLQARMDTEASRQVHSEKPVEMGD